MAFLQMFSDFDWVYHHSLDQRPRQADFEMHIHPTKYEILYVLAGTGTYRTEQCSYPLHPGMIFIARNGEAHQVTLDPDTPYERIVFLLDPRQIRQFDPDGKLLIPFDDREEGHDNAYTDTVFRNTQLVINSQPYNASPQEIRLFAITQVFSFLCEIYSVHASKKYNDVSIQRKQAAIQPALDYIHEHLFDKITLEDVSHHTYISTSQLTKLFNETIGSSVYEYIIVKRLTAAKFKIDSGMSAAHAAIDCGFNTYSSFYKAYRKRFGTSPTASKYKKQD